LDAAKTCKQPSEIGCGFKGTNFYELLDFSAKFHQSLPAEFAAWNSMSELFYSIYSKEQIRLAALFPNPTSEALPLDDSEVFGDKFQDGEFLLTLDDGPTPVGGHTDKYTEMLRKESISAHFFALGNALEKRMDKSSSALLAKLYEKQCLASHGYEHQSHQKWTDWKTSLEKVRALVAKVDPSFPVPFRPPYGQRTVELVAEQMKNANSHVILWNIDSQDWHSKISAEEVGDRVKKLMLLWRKGIILFHDTHPKALVAIPQLINFSRAAQLKWTDCHSIK
jgi:peptidoglycan/xylan/chitin deacetylase (PgdA/CDA1 family)